MVYWCLNFYDSHWAGYNDRCSAKQNANEIDISMLNRFEDSSNRTHFHIIEAFIVPFIAAIATAIAQVGSNNRLIARFSIVTPFLEHKTQVRYNEKPEYASKRSLSHKTAMFICSVSPIQTLTNSMGPYFMGSSYRKHHHKHRFLVFYWTFEWNSRTSIHTHTHILFMDNAVSITPLNTECGEGNHHI